MTLASLNTLSIIPEVNDYQFKGTCYFICQSTISCINAEYCTVTKDRIQVKITQMNAGEQYVLKLTVLNPPYQTIKNLLIWVDNNGTNLDTANIVTQLQTQPITITSD